MESFYKMACAKYSDYFVVNFELFKQNKIVPCKWIEKIDEHIEKFLNYGMNSSQRFRCYYTDNQNAFDENGCPKGDWEPDFDLETIQNSNGDGPSNGCYVIKLIKFKREYCGNAILYVDSNCNKI